MSGHASSGSSVAGEGRVNAPPPTRRLALRYVVAAAVISVCTYLVLRSEPAAKKTPALAATSGETPAVTKRPIATPEAPAKGPEFSPSHLNIGKFEWGQQIPMSLTILNSSIVPSTVKSVRLSCQCTMPQGDHGGTTIEPGETMPVHLILSPEPREGPNSARVEFAFQDGHLCEAVIHFEVVARWQLDQLEVDFGTIDISSDIQLSHPVYFRSTLYHVVDSPVSDVDWLSCDLIPKSEGETEISLTIHADRMQTGVNTGTVTIRTDDETVPTGAIFVRAQAVLPLTSQPAHQVLRPGQSQIIRFVTADDGSQIQLQHVEGGHLGINTNILPGGHLEVIRSREALVEETIVINVRDVTGRSGRVLVTMIE